MSVMTSDEEDHVAESNKDEKNTGNPVRKSKRSSVLQKLRNKVKSGMLSIELSEELTNGVSSELSAKVL